jgi:hypothetical protein
MKKIFIGLLILAAGAGAYYLLSQQKNIVSVSENKEALLLGKWKAGFPAIGKDSLFAGFQYEFLKEGLALIRDTATATTDSSVYEWSKAGELLFRENAADSVTNVYTVLLLTKDSLQVKNKDNKEYLFTRL